MWPASVSFALSRYFPSSLCDTTSISSSSYASKFVLYNDRIVHTNITTSVLGYVAFTITFCYHTEYAYPWIYGPLAFYALDMLMRLLKYRIKDATLVPVDQNMTLVRRACSSSPHGIPHTVIRFMSTIARRAGSPASTCGSGSSSLAVSSSRTRSP